MSAKDRLRSAAFHVLRLAFRMMPLPTGRRDKMRQRFLSRHSSLIPAGPRGKVGTGAARHPADRSGHRLLGYIQRSDDVLPDPLPATIVAFYLPQFHPIAENDAWWGKGFTEWRNVARALPQFEGHAQPKIPGDLGHYDLRVPDILREQARMARQYGVGAFCTYFYWFAGKTLLETPLQMWLRDASIDFPLTLCWANENWSRRWDGREEHILIGQQHSDEDDLAFIAHVSSYLRDPRYLRVQGRPVLSVYRPGLLPDPAATARRWRAWCREHGIGEIHLTYVQSFDNVAPASIGFDAAISFPPNNTSHKPVTASYRLINPDYTGDILDWRQLAADAMSAPEVDYPRYPAVNPGWDNEARRSGRGRTFVHATPRAFETWTRHAIARARQRTPDHPLVFVNAWNEWAEGAILEPDSRYGYAWLEAIRRALRPVTPPRRRPCAVFHVWYPDLLDELTTALRHSGLDVRLILTTPAEREAAVRKEMSRLTLDAELVVSPNRGRDILPFLRIAGRLLDEGEDIVLKLHTKRSTHRDDGANWRNELVERLLAPERAQLIVEAFHHDPTLGIVAPEGHVQPLSFYWGANQANVDYLCSLMGVRQPDADTDAFVAGSMFWCRLRALAPLLDVPLSEEDFVPESGQVDGTMAHAVERVVMLAADENGYAMRTAAAIVGAPDPSGAYAYAKRD